ncbi:MAG: FGGY-family carbohydrate kinase [Acidimicrobiia bacterium]|nr:FGGY-family carbohydrate kinase [Acidimicrobiia bacterium]
MTDYVLAIDLGTSGPKVALVSSRGEVVSPHFEPVGLHLSPDGGAEQDPAEWWQAIGRATRRVLEEAPVPPTEVAAVSCTGQWSGTVPIGEDGHPVANAIIWMDHRGAPYMPELIGGPVRYQGYDPRKVIRWVRLTGGAPTRSGKDPIGHILYLRHERPDVYAATTVFLEPKDYINLRLTGKVAASFDSIALHWVTDNRDPNAVTYDSQLLAIAGLEAGQLPPLLPATEVLGGLEDDAAESLGVPAGIPVLTGTPDLHTAAIGSGAVSDLATHLYVGTSSWLACHVPYKKTDITHSIGSLPAAVPGRYLVTNEQETAGACLDWFGGALFPDVAESEIYERLAQTALEALPGSGGVIFTPWLFGERTPADDSSLRAGFFNQSLETGREHMARAVFEGVAYNTRWLHHYVERFTKARLDNITMVGGGARSDLWAQIFADVLDRTIQQAAEPIWVNVRGAGLLALASLGRIDWLDIPDLVPIAHSIRPDPAHRAVHDRGYETFLEIHQANRRIYKRLDRSR